jgi:uncharacterized membrane protein
MDESIVRWIFVFVGLLSAGLGIPLALGKVPPNLFYGFRTSKTLSSPEIWYPANRSLGADMTVAGIVITVTSAVIAVACPDLVVVAFANLGVLLTTLVVVVVRGFANLRRL